MRPPTENGGRYVFPLGGIHWPSSLSSDSVMRAPSLLMLCVVPLAVTPLPAQSVDPQLLSGLQWRNIGPFRGGRISAVSGVIGQPGVFYFGAANGGVWKTTSAGETDRKSTRLNSSHLGISY